MVKSTVCGPDKTKSAALKLDMTCRIDFMRLYKKTKKKPGKAVTIQNSSVCARCDDGSAIAPSGQFNGLNN
jgi:hypothetical protein